ncbi:hypothetical protein [Pseudomonas sp. 30_B]|uniref:hypothetical protein n=1 Tax=Pseudomonas sp. 30_B TaxID=2813575 RepID=UPI001A9DDB9C|nr:hypothetical protein [Pseudomonas sp. 30_B]
MPGRIARTVAACLLWAAGFCAAPALPPSAMAWDDLLGGAQRMADGDNPQAGSTLGLPSPSQLERQENSLLPTTGHFREIISAGIDPPSKNNKAASVLYGQHAYSAGSAMQPGTGDIAVNITVNNATLKTGTTSAGMTFATDGCNSGISLHNGDTYPNTWSDPLCSGGNETGNADSRALYAQGRLNGSATDNASVRMTSSGGSPHTRWLPIDAGCPARV